MQRVKGYNPALWVNKTVDNSVARPPIYSLDWTIDYKTQGTFMQRVNICLNRLKNLAGTLDSIEKRTFDLKLIYDREVNKTFAGNPTPEKKQEMLDLMWSILKLYLECREVQHYRMVFNYEIEANHIQLSPQEKEDYTEACAVFDGRFPFQLGQRYQKANAALRALVRDFFIDKNLRHYKKAELKDILYFEDNIMNSAN